MNLGQCIIAYKLVNRVLSLSICLSRHVGPKKLVSFLFSLTPPNIIKLIHKTLINFKFKIGWHHSYRSWVWPFKFINGKIAQCIVMIVFLTFLPQLQHYHDYNGIKLMLIITKQSYLQMYLIPATKCGG